MILTKRAATMAMEDTKSKSQVKREMKVLQDLGAELVGLGKERLAELPLDGSLREAISLAREIKAHGGRKRQLKYIGKLLRSRDTEAIRHALQQHRERDRRAAARFHQVEQWRDRLLNDGDAALEELLQSYPRADRQQIRILMRNAAKESAVGKPPAAARTLFRLLRQLICA